MSSACRRPTLTAVPAAASRRWLDVYCKLFIRRLCCGELTPPSSNEVFQKFPPSSSSAATIQSSSSSTLAERAVIDDVISDDETTSSASTSSSISNSCSGPTTEVGCSLRQSGAEPLRHRVFVYGTLKHGQPNHANFDSLTIGGQRRFVGRARSTVAFPLIVATRWNLPFLLYAPGKGKMIDGEIYDVDDRLLAWMDSFEGHPEVYERDEIIVQLTSSPTDDDGLTTTSNSTSLDDNNDVTSKYVNGGGDCNDNDDGSKRRQQTCCRCWAYFLKRFPPGLDNKESYASYDAFGISGNFGKCYQVDEELTGPKSIADALQLECSNTTLTSSNSV